MHTQWQLIKLDAIAKQDSTARAIAALEDDIHHFKNFILRGADYDKRFSVDMDAAGRTAADYKATGAVSTDEEKLTAKLLLAMAFFTPHPGQEAIVMVRKAAPKAAPVLKGAEKRLGVSAFAFAEARDEAQFTRF